MAVLDPVAVPLALGVAFLSAALPSVVQVLRLTRAPGLRRAWTLLGGMIGCFIAAYIVLIGLLPRGAEPVLLNVICGVLLLGGVFVLAVAQLAARTAGDVARIVHLERENVVDALTGAYNRRHLDSTLKEHVAGCGEGRPRLALLMADLDRFKQVNDDYGHLLGDRVLALVASIMARECRAGDTVSRYGGEEFVILAPALDRAAAKAFGERLCRLVRETPVPLPGGGVLSQTMSIGVAVHREGESPAEFVARADAALYAAKAAGRDRVALAPEDAPGRAASYRRMLPGHPARG